MDFVDVILMLIRLFPAIIGLVMVIINFKKIRYQHFPTEEQKEVKAFMTEFSKEYSDRAQIFINCISNSESIYSETIKRWNFYDQNNKNMTKKARKELEKFRSDYGLTHSAFSSIAEKIIVNALKKPHKVKSAELPILQEKLDEYEAIVNAFVTDTMSAINKINKLRAETEKEFWKKEKEKNSSLWRKRETERADEEYASRFGDEYDTEYDDQEEFETYLNREYIGKYFKGCKTKDDVKMVYRKLSKLYHPDSPTGNVEKFKMVTEEYNNLINTFGRRD